MAEPLFGDLLRKYGPEALGALGALIGLSFIERLTILAAGMAFLSGLVFAIVGAPILTHYIEPPDEIRYHVAGGLGLVLGLTGFILAGAVVRAAHSLRDSAPDLVAKVIKRITGG